MEQSTYAGVVLVMAAVAYGLFVRKQRRDFPLVRRALGIFIIFYGVYLSTLTGSAYSFKLPGGSIALGAGTGASIGLGAWALLGTIGVATGGVGIAVGAAAMAGVGALLGGAGGAAGSSFGFQTTIYPLVKWYFWLPIIVIGALFLFGVRRKKPDPQSLSPPTTDETSC